MRLSKIEKQPFIFGRYDLVTPVMRFCFMPNISSKNSEHIAMIAIAGDHLPTCVTAGEKNCKRQSDSAPPIDTRQRSSCSHRPMGGLVWFNTSSKNGPQGRGYRKCAVRPERRATNRAVESQGKFCQRALMGSATSRSAHQCSSKGARKFPATFRETRSATASFAIEDREARSRPSERSTARICVLDAENKKGAAAADELFHQSGRRIRASQLPRKILAQTECPRPPTLERSRARPAMATNRARRSVAASLCEASASPTGRRLQH